MCVSAYVGQDTPKWNALVFKKIRDSIVGPRCRLVISGSAPLSDVVQNFVRWYGPTGWLFAQLVAL